MSTVAAQRVHTRLFLVLVLGATVFAAPAVARFGAARSTPAAPTIEVLSNRADLISGEEALVAAALPPGTDAQQVKVLLGSSDVSSEFALRDNGQYEGLLTGLAVGNNTLTVVLPNGASTSQTIVDHAGGGPLFSGPQVGPWVCQNGSKDPQC